MLTRKFRKNLDLAHKTHYTVIMSVVTAGDWAMKCPSIINGKIPPSHVQ